MPLKLLIAGVDRTAWLANGYSIDIEKVLSTETMHLAILDLDSTAAALRPAEGEDIKMTRVDELGADIELLYGGEIANVIDEPIIDDTGTVTRIRCRDRMALADQVFVDPRTYSTMTVCELFKTIVDEYLGPKGVTVISAPTGGPVVPDLTIEDPVTTVRQTLDRITLQTGWPWRINGDFDAGVIEPGDLPGPATLAADGLSVLSDPPLRWEKQILTQATRVFVQTAAPESGPGPYEYTEDWTADGIASVMPVHVLPTEMRGSTTAAQATLDTTLALTGLPRNAAIRIGARVALDWHTQVYTLSAAATTNADGEVTVTLVEALERDVPEGHPVTFRPGAFVQLEIDGVVTPMDGAPYVWEPITNSIVYPGVAFTLGEVTTYRTWAMHPTFVREWAAVAQRPEGWFDYEHVIDQRVTEEEGHTDLDTARAFAQAELARRLTPPKRVTCTTRIPGHYPLLTVPMNFPDRLVTGDYLVTEVRIRHSNIDENGQVDGEDVQPLFYELVLWEGDSLGESWVQYFRGRNPSQGIRWGNIPPPEAPVKMFDVTIPSGTTTQTITGAGDTPRALFAMSGVLAKGNTAAAAQVSMGAYGPRASSLGMLQTTTLYRTVDNAATTDGRWGASSADLIYNIAPAGGFGDEQYLVVSSVDADGVTFSPSFGAGSGGAAAVMTFPENVFSQASVGLTQLRTSAGTTDVDCKDVTGATFEPDVVIFWASGFVNISETQVPVTDSGRPFFGVAVRGGFQGCVSGFDEVGAAVADSYQYISDTAALRPLSDGALYADAAVTFLSTGFRLTYAAGAPVAAHFRWLALKGGVWTAGVAQAPTSPGTLALDVTGMWPSAVIAAGIAGTSLNSVLNGMGLTWGMAARDPENHYAVWNCSVDAADPSQCDKAVQDALLYWGTDNAPGTPRAVCAVSEWDRDEITLDFATASTAFQFLWLAVGIAP